MHCDNIDQDLKVVEIMEQYSVRDDYVTDDEFKLTFIIYSIIDYSVWEAKKEQTSCGHINIEFCGNQCLAIMQRIFKKLYLHEYGNSETGTIAEFGVMLGKYNYIPDNDFVD